MMELFSYIGMYVVAVLILVILIHLILKKLGVK